MTTEIIKNNHFALLRQREIAEMQGVLWEMEHEKSGAKLAWLQRNDENMTFAIGFRTIPTDSTGVFHILEHSVLAGSDAFPVKEPFVELLKSSLQTFLNAMTYPDKTVYPVSSRNRQDFYNLMRVYLDAVLHPTAVKSPNVFRQEGWRLEFDENGQPMYQGVVYNEMKGAHSDVARNVERAMMEGLFPDSCYRHESGGDPACIPQLTFDQFVSEHKKYYHPSNALVVLDGDVDLNSCLGLLDAVFADYTRQEMVFPIPVQSSMPLRQQRIAYEIGEEESEENKVIVSFGKLLCSYDDPVQLYAASVLADYLVGDAQAPLKQAILDGGLGADFHMELNDGMQQAWFGWQVWNTSEDRLDQIRSCIRAVVSDLLEKGLDQERLMGCYNSLAFRLLDRDSSGYPRGLMESLTMLDSWLYGGDPAQNLRYRAILAELKEKIGSGALEQMMKRLLLDDAEGFLAVLVPDKTLGQRRNEEEKQRAANGWAALSREEKEAAKDALDRFHRWQQTPDSPEALASIPMLSLADVQSDPRPLPCEARTCAERPMLIHDVGGDLTYLNLHFDCSDVSPEEMGLLRLTCDMLGTLQTVEHTASALQTAVRQVLGQLSFQPAVYQLDCGHHRTIFTASGVCLSEYAQAAAKLVVEILTTTQFEDTDALGKLLRRKKVALQQRLIGAGNRYAASRVAARQTSAGAAREQLGGFEYFRYVAGLADAAPETLKKLLEDMAALCRRIFCRSRMTLSLSRNGQELADMLLNSFDMGVPAPAEACFAPLPPCREGIRIPAGVGYAAKGANLERFGTGFTGQMYVLSNLLTYEYLWSEVRVKGGAYGTGFRASPGGDCVATSYRDPTPGKSIATFDRCADAVRELCGGGEDLTRYILGAMTDADPLMGAQETISLSETRFFRGITQEDALRRRRELLNCTPEQLLALCAPLEQVAKEENCCIIGGPQQLADAAALLDTILDLPG